MQVLPWEKQINPGSALTANVNMTSLITFEKNLRIDAAMRGGGSCLKIIGKINVKSKQKIISEVPVRIFIRHCITIAQKSATESTRKQN